MDLQQLAKKFAETVVLVIDEDGIESLISELLKGFGDNQASIRRGSSYLMGYLFKNSKLYLGDEAPNMISTLIEKSSEVRKSVEVCIGEILRVSGQGVTKSLKDLRGPALAHVLERMHPLSAIQESLAVSTGATSKPGSKVAKSGVNGYGDRMGKARE